MATVSTPPALPVTASSRYSSFGYSDIYGASDAAGPTTTAGGSLGGQVAQTPAVVVTTQAVSTLGQLHELGHSLVDSPTGILGLALVAVVLLVLKEAVD